jgi:hypothetical protein
MTIEKLRDSADTLEGRVARAVLKDGRAIVGVLRFGMGSIVVGDRLVLDADVRDIVVRRT